MKLAWFCAFLVTASACLFAQNSGESLPGTVKGKVLMGQGSEGVRKATVRLSGPAGVYSATSDAEGDFTLEAVKPGRYTITVEHPGLVPLKTGPHSSDIQITANQPASPIIVRMQPAGVITGKIVDADGDPIRNANVSASPAGLSARNRRLGVENASTNDLGEFRISDLLPGHYIVSAHADVSPSPASSPIPANDHHPTQGHEVYATTYYPGTLEKDQAVAVQVQSGDETPVRFGLLTTPAYRVSGFVVGAPKATFTELFLESAETGAGFGELRAHIGEAGSFSLPSVLAGTYRARINAVEISGNRPNISFIQLSPSIDVKSDLDGVKLLADPSGRVQGRLKLDTAGKFDFTQLVVMLSPIGENGSVARHFGPPAVAPCLADGSFELPSVASGTYQLVLIAKNNNLRDYFTKSVEQDGQDVSDSGLQVRGNTNLSVTISARGASIEGTVIDDAGTPLPGVAAVLIPDGPLRTHPDLYMQETTDDKGHFQMRGLNPGSYTAFAFEETPGDTQQPEFLKQYDGHGTSTTVKEGGHQTISLKLVPVEQD